MFRPGRAAGRVVRAFLLLLIAPVGTGVARGQSPDMVTDRPDQTESATVVPRGLLQVETGYLFARDGDVDGYAVPGTLFRLGLGGRLELRIGHSASAMGCEIGRIRPTSVFERAGESRMTPPASSISSQVRPRISFLRQPE